MMANAPIRILIVANKTWECDPLIAVLLSKDGPPGGLLGNFVRGFDPAGRAPAIDPSTGLAPTLPPEAEGLALRSALPARSRLSFDVGPHKAPVAVVEVWCVEDWMRRQRHIADGLAPVSGSSSHEKFTVALPIIRARAFEGQGCDLVIAFGTAGIPADQTFNGCVTIGSRAYIHDPWHDASPDEVATQERRFGPLLHAPLADWFDKRLDCPRLSASLFATGVSVESRHAAEGRFIEAPINPARPPRILAGHGYASLGTLNICDYDDYVWADEETHRRFETQVRQREIGSAETTHGLIRLVWHDTPFLFVSALTDRVPNFNAEVTPRKYSQNFAAAHNAGVALAHLLPELGRLAALEKDGLFDPKGATIQWADGDLPKPGWPVAPSHPECPDHARGESALDCPWAGLARSMVAVASPAAVVELLRAQAPRIAGDIARARECQGCFESWGRCLNFDELALAAIVDPTILGVVAAIAGETAAGPAWHAGLTHTYGYLFSLLRTSFGYKRQRWVGPELALSFGLPAGMLGPTPDEGTLLTNVTWLFGQLAFRGEDAPLARLKGFEARVPPALHALPYGSFRRHRVVETVSPSGAEARKIDCRTDLIELPKAGTDTHLLVYSIDAGDGDGAQLISGFAVGAGSVRALLGAGGASAGREVRTRYNAYVPGLTQLGAWRLAD